MLACSPFCYGARSCSDCTRTIYRTPVASHSTESTKRMPLHYLQGFSIKVPKRHLGNELPPDLAIVPPPCPSEQHTPEGPPRGNTMNQAGQV
eukprot:1174504-Amphidinium_carterae.1